jgi:two-component system, chemotaxis family, CheB/CheR fusion protein
MNDIGSKYRTGKEKDQRIAELEKKLREAEETRVVVDEQSNSLRQMLAELNNELGSLLTGSETGAMFLDTQLRIKSTTPGIQKHFNIIRSDVGRPITELVSNLIYEALEHDVKQVISTSVLKEIVIQSKHDRWFNVRIMPHLEGNDVIDGVMLTMTDITNLKKTEDQLRDSGEKILASIEKSPVVVWNQDMDLRYTWIHNPKSFKPEETIGKKDEDLMPSGDATNLTKIKRRVLDTGVGTRENVRTTLKGKTYYYDLVIEPLFDKNSVIIGISCASMEINKKTFKKTLSKR